MRNAKSTYLFVAAMTTGFVVGGYHLWTWMVADLHGMPSAKLSEVDTNTNLSMTLAFSLVMTLIIRVVYARLPRPERNAAVTAALTTVMCTCFAAIRGFSDAIGVALLLSGLVIGVIAALVALFAELDEHVGSARLLATAIAQIIVITSLVP